MTDQAPVLHYYRLVDAGDFGALAALFTPAAVYRRPGYPDLAGRTAIEHFYRHERLIHHGEHTLQSVLHDGPRYAVHGRFDGVLRDGTTVSIEFADFFTVDGDGGFVSRTTFFFTPLV
ncbi:nuclear transport factor 2 family protein [Actinokineospora cianjurensis]|uniref:Ketosteroid isomerase-like protein n=1 Tax=Actinokineospora cianjurensis TaxID=585224 RepID=A0A421B2Y3_9PSEU|nr:nuclear transport factor 2 family protein [Actinokineospora cianjurensis]RLK58739.1 ketosteroid isomerase-like protein [Actinokineospora cianjurensis]